MTELLDTRDNVDRVSLRRLFESYAERAAVPHIGGRTLYLEVPRTDDAPSLRNIAGSDHGYALYPFWRQEDQADIPLCVKVMYAEVLKALGLRSATDKRPIEVSVLRRSIGSVTYEVVLQPLRSSSGQESD